MPADISFGQFVKKHRLAIGLTQVELSGRVGCATITLRRIEGETLRPSVQIAERLAMALDIPLQERANFVRLARTALLGTPEPPAVPAPTPEAEEIGAEDLTGRAVRGYELGERIGSGGFGAVYRAVQPGVEREVALKIILPQYANHPEFIRRFEAEAHLVARLEHPFIVPLYDFWREPNAAYLAMRLLRGGSLRPLLEKGPLPLDFFWQVLNQVGTALHAAHRFGIIHRDLKPDNILLDEDNNAYLADFGIAKNLGNPDPRAMTSAGDLIGSPAYMSPEQIRAEPVRPQADIYCLGVMLFEMLTGVLPFPGPTPVDQIMHHLNQPLPSLQEQDLRLPPQLDAIIHKATEKDPQARYQSIPELLEDVRITFSQPVEGQVWEVAGLPDLPLVDPAFIDNPFKGLRAFTEADAEHFFGRNALVQSLLSRMGQENDTSRFLAVVGPSGSGKSSVVKAGFVPAIRRGALPGSEHWFVVDFMPGRHPFEELEAALLRVAVNPPESLLQQIQEDERGLIRAVKRILPADEHVELLMVIDQFEEIFSAMEDESVRARFLDSIVAAVLEPRSRVRVVITMRADFTDRPLGYVDFGEMVRRQTEFVLPLTPDELEQAITGPVRESGLLIEPALLARILRELGDQPGTLPLLQYALTELFERRDGRRLTVEAYQEIGGVLGALGQRAEEIFAGLDENGKGAARQLFLRLVTLGEGVEDTRRRVLLEEVVSLQGVSGFRPDLEKGGDRIQRVLDQYGDARLLTFDHDPATRLPTVEVAHEAILREWERLRGWLNESREEIRLQRQLGRAAEEWEAAGKDPSFLLRGARLAQFETWGEETDLALSPVERTFLEAGLEARVERESAEAERQAREAQLETRSRNFLRALVGVFAVATLVAVLLSIFAFGQQGIAQAEAQGRATALIEAEQAAELADANAAEAQAEAQARATAQAEAEAAQDFAEEQQGLAEAQAAVSAREAQVNHSLLLAEQSRAALEASNFDLALALAVAANQIEDPPGRAQMALSEAAYAPGGTIRLFEGHDPAGRVFGVAVSPDGRHMLSGSESGEVFWWGLASGEIVRRLEGHTSGVWRVAVSPDGRYGLSGDLTQVIYWDLETGAQIFTMSGVGEVNDVAFSPDGRIAATAHGGSALGGEPLVDDNSIRFWDLESGEEIRRVAFGDAVRDLAFSPDGNRIAAISWEEHVVVLEVASGETLVRAGQEIADLNAVVFGPTGGDLIVTGQPVGTNGWRPVKIDLETGEEIPFNESHSFSGMVALRISPNGSSVVSVGGGFQVWDLESLNLIRTGLANSDGSFLPDGSGLVVTQDEFVRLVALDNGGLAGEPQLPSIDNFVGGLAYSPDGLRALVNGFNNGFLGEYDLETGTLIRNFERDPEAFPSAVRLIYSPDGRTALSAHFLDQSLSYWDLETGQEIRKLSQPGGRPWEVVFHPGGEYALSAGSYAGPEATSINQLAYWNLSTGESVWTVGPEYTVQLRGAAINPNGETALTGGIVAGITAGVLHMWDLETGTQIMSLEGHGHLIWDIEYIDENTALTASEDTTLILWDLETGQPIRYFYGHTQGIKEIALNPDHTLAASISRDGTVILWDIATSQPIRRYYGHPGQGTSVAFNPDGLEVMSGGEFGENFRWRVDATLADLLGWVQKNRYLRAFTCVERVIYTIEPLCEE